MNAAVFDTRVLCNTECESRYTGPGFWAYLTASRFADHLPYYRLEDILSRHRFRIDRSTQWRWMSAFTGSQLESLLPDHWIAEHPEHLIQERVDEA